MSGHPVSPQSSLSHIVGNLRSSFEEWQLLGRRFDIPVLHGSVLGQYHTERRHSVGFESKTNHEVTKLSMELN